MHYGLVADLMCSVQSSYSDIRAWNNILSEKQFLSLEFGDSSEVANALGSPQDAFVLIQ